MHLTKSHGMWRAEKARNSHICLHLAMKLAVHLTNINMNTKLNAPYHTALPAWAGKTGLAAGMPVRGLFARAPLVATPARAAAARLRWLL
jgi:hypothetical protein